MVVVPRAFVPRDGPPEITNPKVATNTVVGMVLAIRAYHQLSLPCSRFV